MTRKEQAKFTRLEKRRQELFTALAVISAWLTIDGDTEELLYRISKYCTEKIEADRCAAEKERMRDGK